jgi:hypothetical protein
VVEVGQGGDMQSMFQVPSGFRVISRGLEFWSGYHKERDNTKI